LKGFLLLLVLAAAGLAGVLYWRQSLQARSAPVATAAGEPAKEGKERRRRRRGVRRLARNQVFAAPAPSGDAPMAEDTSAAFARPPEDRVRAPLAPGGSSTTEAPPSEVFGAISAPAPTPSGVRHQPIDEPEPVKLRAADLKIVWQGEDLSRPEAMTLDFSKDSGGPRAVAGRDRRAFPHEGGRRAPLRHPRAA
jgi:hypothetical protein